MTGAPAPLKFAATIACPSCGHEFTGRWTGHKTGAQQCPSCGRVFEATWPGFIFAPETVIIGPSGEEPGRGAA